MTKTNKKKLEHFYNLGLAFEKQGDFDKAADAYHNALAVDPEDFGGIRIRLASINRGETPVSASKAYVATLFDQNADMFDYILVDQLGYDVPLQLRDKLITIFPERKFQSMLDLGCGTGLSGDALDDLACEKTGVDLSENMIKIAHEKGDYQQLFVGDVVDFVTKADRQWDLIVATDVLPYMGDVAVFFDGIGQCLQKNGVFGFSTETLALSAFDGLNYKVGPHQRFAHQQTYIEDLLNQNALECLAVSNIVVRAEQGKPVPGQLFLAKKQ